MESGGDPQNLQTSEFALPQDTWEIHALSQPYLLPKLNSNHPRSGKGPYQNRFLSKG